MTERVLTPPIEPITAPVRSTAVDIVKGIAIFLVVIMHTAQGLYSRGWWVGGMTGYFIDIFIYSFHMPAFFFVAGLFLAGSIQRRGALSFTLDKVKTLLYPYFVWAVLAESVDPLISSFRSSPHTFHLSAFLKDLLTGNMGWFLPTLFCCQIIALCTIKLPAWLRLLLAVFAAALCRTFEPEILSKIVWNFCFLAGGIFIGRSIFRLNKLPVWAAPIIAVLIFSLQWAMTTHYGGHIEFGVPPEWLAVGLGFSGTAGLFLIARTIEGSRFGDSWAWIGRASLGIFLMAPFPQGATREILVRWAHTNAFWPQLLLPTVAATLIPAVVWHQQQRLRLGWLFHWPSR